MGILIKQLYLFFTLSTCEQFYFQGQHSLCNCPSTRVGFALVVVFRNCMEMDYVIKKLVIHLICNEHMNSCCGAASVMQDKVAQVLAVFRVLIGRQLV